MSVIWICDTGTVVFLIFTESYLLCYVLSILWPLKYSFFQERVRGVCGAITIKRIGIWVLLCVKLIVKSTRFIAFFSKPIRWVQRKQHTVLTKLVAFRKISSANSYLPIKTRLLLTISRLVDDINFILASHQIQCLDFPITNPFLLKLSKHVPKLK